MRDTMKPLCFIFPLSASVFKTCRKYKKIATGVSLKVIVPDLRHLRQNL